MGTPVIQLENLVKTYNVGETEVQALRGVNYTVDEGDFVAIMGPSGSGKSTLMNILGCLDRPTSGKYFLEGEEVSTFDKNKLATIRNQKIGFVFQTFNLLSRTTGSGERRASPPLFRTSTQGEAPNGRWRPWNRSGSEPGPSQDQPALRRRAAADRHRPGPAQQSHAHPGRRADGQPGHQDEQRDHGHFHRPQRGEGHHHHHGDP